MIITVVSHLCGIFWKFSDIYFMTEKKFENNLIFCSFISNLSLLCFFTIEIQKFGNKYTKMLTFFISPDESLLPINSKFCFNLKFFALRH